MVMHRQYSQSRMGIPPDTEDCAYSAGLLNTVRSFIRDYPESWDSSTLEILCVEQEKLLRELGDI